MVDQQVSWQIGRQVNRLARSGRIVVVPDVVVDIVFVVFLCQEGRVLSRLRARLLSSPLAPRRCCRLLCSWPMRPALLL
jgi:hypothetical protein